jgi:hypothetical protein
MQQYFSLPFYPSAARWPRLRKSGFARRRQLPTLGPFARSDDLRAGIAILAVGGMLPRDSGKSRIFNFERRVI